MNKLKLIKFRSLGSDNEFKRIKEILKTNKFWCSKLWNLNDPMEGVYRNSFFNSDDIFEMFTEKNNKIICSFSHITALNNNLLWGYYANGFKGVAIEIEINEIEIKKMNYFNIQVFNQNLHNVDDIITRKLKDWEHEQEYRFICDSSKDKKCKIGKITKVYFGSPYDNTNNRENIEDNSPMLRKYDYLKRELQLLCKDLRIATENFNHARVE